MRFSWTGLLLAPLAAPLAFAAAMAASAPGGRPLPFFLALLAAGCAVSYGATVGLFLPTLYLLSARWPLTGWRVCPIGGALGAVAFVPLAWMAWRSSGPDSGPPAEGFVTFFLRWAADPLAAIFPAAGLVTAAAYWWLGTRRRRRAARAAR